MTQKENETNGEFVFKNGMDVLCFGKGYSHGVTNDQTGIICYSFQLYSRKKSFRLVLKYPKILSRLFFEVIMCHLSQKKISCL